MEKQKPRFCGFGASSNIVSAGFDEIIVNDFTNHKKDIPELLTGYSNITFIFSVDVNNKEDIEFFNNLYESNYSNFKLRLYNADLIYNQTSIPEIKYEVTCPYFFNTWAVENDTFKYLLTTPVTDIYVAQSICFSMHRLQLEAKERHKQLRVFPDIAQTACQYTNDVEKFWVRPEAIQFYDNEVIIWEFWNINRQKVLLDIYKEGRWFGPLLQIINGITDENIDGRFIDPTFDIKRIQCEKRCSIGPCQFCHRILALGKTLKENELYIDLKKTEEE